MIHAVLPSMITHLLVRVRERGRRPHDGDAGVLELGVDAAVRPSASTTSRIDLHVDARPCLRAIERG